MIKKIILFEFLLFISFLTTNSIAETQYQETFRQSLRQSVENAIHILLDSDPVEIKRAVNNLGIKEATLLLSADYNIQNYYIVRAPKSFQSNYNALMAYIFMLYQAEKGIDLRPVTYFQGQSFTFLSEKEEDNDQ